MAGQRQSPARSLLLGGVGAGYFYADQYVERKLAVTSQPLIVVLKNRPAWMNDFLVEQIEFGVLK